MKTTYERYKEITYTSAELKKQILSSPLHPNEKQKKLNQLYENQRKEKLLILKELIGDYPIARVDTGYNFELTDTKGIPYPCMISGEFIICFKPYFSDATKLFRRSDGIEWHPDVTFPRYESSRILNLEELKFGKAPIFSQCLGVLEDLDWLVE